MKLLKTFFVVGVVMAGLTAPPHLSAADRGRATMAAEPPVEPRSLFQMPTGGVVKSMDAEVSGLGVLYGNSSKPAFQAALGLGDIAQMEAGALGIVSNLREENELAAVSTVGLKVHVPLGRYVRGVSASFQRSGSHTDVVDFVDWSAKVGEFHAVTTMANHGLEDVESAAAGWNGVKLQTHLGLKYMDARLERGTDPIGMTEKTGTFWRPVVGFEVWRDNSRARVVGELNWMTRFDDVNGGVIDVVRVVSGGVRFFFSKHATFDIGVRQQSNYDGIAEAAIQTKLTLHLPTHTFRDRVVGN
jgi:hypothetical protein